MKTEYDMIGFDIFWDNIRKYFGSFAKEESKTYKNGITIYRFIRNGKSNLGGITFRFDIDYDAKKVSAWWAICSDTDNFSRNDGHEIVDWVANNYYPLMFDTSDIDEHSGCVNVIRHFLTQRYDASYHEIVGKLKEWGRTHKCSVFESQFFATTV